MCGFTHTDTQLDLDNLIARLLRCKLWSEDGKWTKSVVDLGYQIMLVSNFTLYH